MTTTPAALSEEKGPTLKQCVEWLASHVDQGGEIPPPGPVFLPREYRAVILATLRSRPNEGMREALVKAREWIPHDWECELHILQWDENERKGIRRQGEKCTCDLKSKEAFIDAALALPAAVAPAETFAENPNHDRNKRLRGRKVAFPAAPIEQARGEELRQNLCAEAQMGRHVGTGAGIGMPGGTTEGEMRGHLVSMAHALERAIAALSAPSLEDARDAARYRWLRQGNGERWMPPFWGRADDEIDAAIDAARTKP